MVQEKSPDVHPYAGRIVALATKHGKERQIAPPLREVLNMSICVPDVIDTDLLGTFTGEIPRQGSPAEVVLQKARLGMHLSKLPLGLANEGSFGPHPEMPMLIADTELLLFVDDERGIQIQEVLVSEDAVAVQCTAHSIDELTSFLARAQFPSHGLIVRPHEKIMFEHIVKGITDIEVLEQAIKHSVALASDGLALIETDLRAHMNPTRQRVIARLAERLAERLLQLCPHCSMPGWGIVDSVRGLPCEWCGEATSLMSELIYGCPLCSYQEHAPRPDGLRNAPAAQCSLCNP